MITEKLVNLNIDTAEFERVFTPNVNKVSEILRKYGFDVRVVGGAVRDFLQGKAPRDIDFATDADPSELIYIFNLEEIEHDDWGIGHGTIKAVFGNDKIDVTSIAYKLELIDGRVRMITGQDWEQDAQHRDLTINSLSVDREGTIYDYVGGLDDLKAQIVRMNPITRDRVADDPHLIMRWFKALGQFKNTKFDKIDYQIIKKSMPLLQNIKGEEKTDREMASILTSKNGQKIIRLMCNMGAEKYLGINCEQL
jgi:tRNA nucleotidyltransferase/poly(A) polymerase